MATPFTIDKAQQSGSPLFSTNVWLVGRSGRLSATPVPFSNAVTTLRDTYNALRTISTAGQKVLNLSLARTLHCPVDEDALNLPFSLIVIKLGWLSPAIEW